MKINAISPDYPEYLKMIQTIATPPKRLWYIGNLPENRLPTVAIVGTRKPTAYGREVVEQLSSELAKHGVVVASGLALGIDALAHKAALKAGGKTIAILPCGLDQIYPVHIGSSHLISCSRAARSLANMRQASRHIQVILLRATALFQASATGYS